MCHFRCACVCSVFSVVRNDFFWNFYFLGRTIVLGKPRRLGYIDTYYITLAVIAYVFILPEHSINIRRTQHIEFVFIIIYASLSVTDYLNQLRPYSHLSAEQF